MTRLASWADYGTHDESAYPELWRGVVRAYASCLGPTGLRLHDLSRYRNWGTLTNMDAATDWVVSSGRYALDFDGTNDYVNSDLSFGISGDFSFSCWVRLAAFSVLGAAMVSYVTSYTNYYAFLGILNDPGSGNPARWQFALFDGTNNPQALSAINSAALNEWVHLAGVRSLIEDNIKLYVNGRLIATTTDSTTSTPAYSGLYFGGQLSTRFLNGQLDDFFVHSRGLSPPELRTLATRRGIAYERRKRKQLYIPQTSARRRKILTGQV